MAISNNNTGIRTGVCTSTTRPTAPYEGQHIYETDTDIEYVWNGSAWVVNYVSAASPAFTGTPTAPTAAAGTNTTQIATMASKPWNTAWGFVAQTTLATSIGYITAIQDILSITFTSVANRRYRYTATGLLVSNAAGHFNAGFCDSSNTNLREYFTYFANSSNAYTTGFFDYTETIATSGSVTRKIRHHETSTPGVLYYGSNVRDQIAWKIRVEDIGPA